MVAVFSLGLPFNSADNLAMNVPDPISGRWFVTGRVRPVFLDDGDNRSFTFGHPVASRFGGMVSLSYPIPTCMLGTSVIVSTVTLNTPKCS
jgi:hypothetical protein